MISIVSQSNNSFGGMIFHSDLVIVLRNISD